MDQGTDTGDHEDHEYRQLVELQAPVDHQIPHRHPPSVAHDMQRLFRRSLHIEEQRDRDAEGRQDHARTDP